MSFGRRSQFRSRRRDSSPRTARSRQIRQCREQDVIYQGAVIGNQLFKRGELIAAVGVRDAFQRILKSGVRFGALHDSQQGVVSIGQQ